MGTVGAVQALSLLLFGLLVGVVLTLALVA